MLWLFWISGAFLAYTFVGYPAMLWLLAKVRNRSHRRATIWPTLSVIIPAHNAAPFLREKLLNTLELEYPKDRREIIVVSDGSEDDTAKIAVSFAAQGVKLIEIPERMGKHHAQMVARDLSTGEVLVFTDAGVQLERGALKRVASNFADPLVGCVSSEDRILAEQKNGTGEGSYVNFEMWLRRLEAQVGTMVSVSGSFFAARREVCGVWHPEQSSDFFIPLHTVARSLRVVVDPECRGYYGLTRQSDAEFQRKVRTIVHGLDVFFTHLKLLNPLRQPMFAWQLVSHKLFRWLVPFAVAGLWIANCFLWHAGTFYQICLVLQFGLYVVGLLTLGWHRLVRIKVFELASLFMLGILATAAAWVRFCSGERFVSWQPTQRS